MVTLRHWGAGAAWSTSTAVLHSIALYYCSAKPTRPTSPAFFLEKINLLYDVKQTVMKHKMSYTPKYIYRIVGIPSTFSLIVNTTFSLVVGKTVYETPYVLFDEMERRFRLNLVIQIPLVVVVVEVVRRSSSSRSRSRSTTPTARQGRTQRTRPFFHRARSSKEAEQEVD